MDLLTFGDYILLSALLPAVVFLVFYVFSGAPWWESLIGWMFVCSGIASVVVTSVVLLSLFLGADYPGREIVRIIGYALQSSALYLQVIVYFIERRSPIPALPFRKDHL